MPDAIENYTPQIVVRTFKKQARAVWSFGFCLALAWVFLIALAPLAEINNLNNISNPIYEFFGYVCHQNPARSFHLHGRALAVCSRCFGVYFGLFGGFLIYPLLRRIDKTEPSPRFWLFAAMIPMAVDWLLGVFEIWENTHSSRFLTGAVLGAACAAYIVPALIELFRLLLNKRREKRLPI